MFFVFHKYDGHKAGPAYYLLSLNTSVVDENKISVILVERMHSQTFVINLRNTMGGRQRQNNGHGYIWFDLICYKNINLEQIACRTRVYHTLPMTVISSTLYGFWIPRYDKCTWYCWSSDLRVKFGHSFRFQRRPVRNLWRKTTSGYHGTAGLLYPM